MSSPSTNDGTKMWCPDLHGAQGTREWCEYCGLDTVPGTNHATENDVTGSVSASQGESVSVGTEALTGLTRDELWSVWRAVRDRLHQCPNERALWSAWSKLNDALEL